jgi:hypothetical protein
VDLEPGTAYELRLKLDRGERTVTRMLSARTRMEPTIAKDAPVRYVAPDVDLRGGGSGTEAEPFRGLAVAQAAARPGDVFVLRAGEYTGSSSSNALARRGGRSSGGGRIGRAWC